MAAVALWWGGLELLRGYLPSRALVFGMRVFLSLSSFVYIRSPCWLGPPKSILCRLGWFEKSFWEALRPSGYHRGGLGPLEWSAVSLPANALWSCWLPSNSTAAVCATAGFVGKMKKSVAAVVKHIYIYICLFIYLFIYIVYKYMGIYLNIYIDKFQYIYLLCAYILWNMLRTKWIEQNMSL